jgi:hypothetical protein
MTVTLVIASFLLLILQCFATPTVGPVAVAAVVPFYPADGKCSHFLFSFPRNVKKCLLLYKVFPRYIPKLCMKRISGTL